MTDRVAIKAGASLNLGFEFQNDDGTPVDLTNALLASQVRDALGDIIATLPLVVATPTSGSAAVSVADTSQWPPGLLRCDVRLTIAGNTLLSETFGIFVAKGVTV